jgi:hypothetical protein
LSSLACDPQLAISDGPLTKRTIEGCPEALDHLHECCPKYDSYLSCTVTEKWEGQGSADLTSKESRCLRAEKCEAMEKAIGDGKKLCGVTWAGHRCR